MAAADRRYEELQRRADEQQRRSDEQYATMLSLVSQLKQNSSSSPRSSQSVKQESPPFIPPTESKIQMTQPAPALSSSQAGSSSLQRHQQLLATSMEENQHLLAMSKEHANQFGALHNPTVPSFPLLPQQQQHSVAPQSTQYSMFASSSPPPPPSSSSSQQQPLLFLPRRLLHHSPSDNPSTAEALMTAFLHERRSGDLQKKKIKSYSDFMRGMEEAMTAASMNGNTEAVKQSVQYLTLMTQFNEQYGWAAADCYWYELQQEVARGHHSLAAGSPFNARAYAAMVAKYSPLNGRPSTTKQSSTTTAPTTPAPSGTRKKSFHCSHHGHNTTHNTADCHFLARKSGPAPAKSTT